MKYSALMPLPVPDVIELLDPPTEFGALPRSPLRPPPVAPRRAKSAPPVHVEHLDDARASVYALFA
jgi:hypothetical protein